ncbi:hypothetical protein SK128_001157 [Halocaridina rubra]|uniref:Uncharacterized protein n=1 Tax=Halocaridina rubra TaxID=373956 RepID=A0AAN8XPS6_HALRR
MGRCLSILKQDYPDIHASKETTKFVFIGNAGLTTKADESSLTELINSVGCGLESIILVPEKSYSFASFFREKDAEIFVSSANGQKNVPGSSAPVYLSYVNKGI